jgi:hypothetical protein
LKSSHITACARVIKDIRLGYILEESVKYCVGMGRGRVGMEVEWKEMELYI